MIRSLLVANRGEIACRVFETCQRLGIEKHAVYSDADADSKHVRMADRALRIGEGPAAASYLNVDAVRAAAKELGSEAIHPGYGFLSENSDFARRVIGDGTVWIGPDPESMDAMSEKIPSRLLMREAGVPVVPGSEAAVTELASALAQAEQIGYPVVVKASAGGGGIGMTIIRGAIELESAFATARATAERYFSSSVVYLEKYIARARHVEVQVLGLNSGQVVIVGDRDCSVQRRHQKVLEEAPCPILDGSEREYVHEVARAAAAQVKYRGAGTVEMILDLDDRSFYFLEMNTRLQVEHPVTELVTGVDLVEAQIRIASGENLDNDLVDRPAPVGHAFEFRVYAEDPVKFLPGPGVITEWEEPAGEHIRVDSGYGLGDTVTPYYDPLLAKLCVWGKDRGDALATLAAAAAQFKIVGPKNNLPIVDRVVNDPNFADGNYDTNILLNRK